MFGGSKFFEGSSKMESRGARRVDKWGSISTERRRLVVEEDRDPTIVDREGWANEVLVLE